MQPEWVTTGTASASFGSPAPFLRSGDNHDMAAQHIPFVWGSALLVGAALVVPITHAQRAPGTAMVTMDFTARERGEAVQDLVAEELTLRVNGRPRPITSLQLIQLGRAPLQTIPEPFATNRPEVSGRTILFALDLPSIRAGREAPLRSAIRTMAASLQPEDRVALALVPYDGIVVDFTTDHAAVIDRILAANGRAMRAEASSDFACRSRVTLESIRGLFDSLSGGVGPTTVVLVSSALAGPVRDGLTTQFPGQCELRPMLFQDVADAAAVARANVYVVDPEDSPSVGATRAGLEHLAGVTGGELLPLASTGPAGLVRMVSEASTFYLATFDAAPDERNGSRHRVDLRTNRQGLSIQMRSEVHIPRARADAPVTRRVASEMLTDPRHFRDLAMRGTVYLSRDDDPAMVRIVPIAELVDPSAALQSAAIGVYAADGRLVAQWAVQPGTAVPSPIAGALSVAPGRYRVRIAATVADGRAGVLDQNVDAALDGRGRWVVSSVLLGLSREGAFVPRLQFADEPVAIGRIELFGPVPPDGLVRFELARTVEGPAIVSVAGTLTATDNPSRHLSTGALPIGGFVSGRWIVRAVVSPDGVAPLRVIRTLEKVKR